MSTDAESRTLDGPFLAMPEWQVEQECAEKSTTQKSVALTYALALRAAAVGGVAVDWKRLNGAILARWSFAGLNRIKTLAWKYVEGKAKP